MYQAIQMGIVDVRLLGEWNWEARRVIEPEYAECFDSRDSFMIRNSIENSCGWDVVGSCIINRISSILATRDEWPAVKPWEWMVLEGISRNDGKNIEEAASDSNVNWDVRVGSTYGDPDDTDHVYHRVQSFGGLRVEEGQTLLQIAKANGSLNAAATIEKLAAAAATKGALELWEEAEMQRPW